MQSISESAQKKTLNELNYDTLLKICKLVGNFNDQVVFAETCKIICDIYVKHIWSQKLIVDPMIMHIDKDSLKEHLIYVKHMRQHFTVFVAGFHAGYPNALKIYLEQLDLMEIKKLPAVTKCLFDNSFQEESDEIMFKLSELMPNVKVLKFFGRKFRFHHVSKFQHLEELVIKNVCIMERDVKHSFGNLTRLHILGLCNHSKFRLNSLLVPTLQVLRLGAFVEEEEITDILALQNLGELEVRYNSTNDYCERSSARVMENLLPHVINKKAAQITSLIVNNNATLLLEDWTNELPQFQLPKLKTLIFNNWEYERMFLDGHLRESNLEILAMGDWIDATPDSLRKLVSNFNQLELLQISSQYTYYHEALLEVENALRLYDRSRRLSVCHWMQPEDLLTQENLSYWMKSKYVEVAYRSRTFFRQDLFGFNVKFDKSTNA